MMEFKAWVYPLAIYYSVKFFYDSNFEDIRLEYNLINCIIWIITLACVR